MINANNLVAKVIELTIADNQLIFSDLSFYLLGIILQKARISTSHNVIHNENISDSGEILSPG